MNKLLPESGEKIPSLEKFAEKVFPGTEFTPFHRSYYAVLEAFARRRIRRLMITVPPQHGKSFGSSQLLPAYMLGLDPELRIAITSYSASLATKFNKRVQRLIDSAAYASIFPNTAIKGVGNKNSNYIRTADHTEIIGHHGELMSVGREGSLTGNRVDIFIIDDLYKDAMEANSPIVRENCWEWYVSVVRTRMHNDSSELIVFTRWHDEDLIGRITEKETAVKLNDLEQIDSTPPDTWFILNFEAIKESQPTALDPRGRGEALWPERHSLKTLEDNRRLDPVKFQAMYQGNPTNASGFLYGANFQTYHSLPCNITGLGNYTDTADMGDDYLCSVCYARDSQGMLYVTDVVYSREGMEVTENLVAAMLREHPEREVIVESNNGGRGFARAVSRLLPNHAVKWFQQTANKEARILSNSSAVLRNIAMPEGWQQRWPEFAAHLQTYQRTFRNNRWHDAPDVLTGIIERELTGRLSKKIRAITFIKE
jgi:predicted phage terminase large subunit-like protein